MGRVPTRQVPRRSPSPLAPTPSKRSGNTLSSTTSRLSLSLSRNPANKKEIFCDEKLKSIFEGKDAVGFQEIVKLLSVHFVKLIDENKMHMPTLDVPFASFVCLFLRHIKTRRRNEKKKTEPDLQERKIELLRNEE
ncbi:hypothetical protein CIPAW_11G075000 [Carya illinoinensis]|uniref:SWIB domain-containing protein n=1 Tax=Carya illinoinensis TaxID=32201 RepID=A0A8T1P0U4_CARIL|nr:hypothetical protein CIPAW_11G075000 [Carya illinoinensis]